VPRHAYRSPMNRATIETLERLVIRAVFGAS
jgi:hypothetical protein